jgi:hypothetical protein
MALSRYKWTTLPSAHIGNFLQNREKRFLIIGNKVVVIFRVHFLSQSIKQSINKLKTSEKKTDPLSKRNHLYLFTKTEIQNCCQRWTENVEHFQTRQRF